MEWINSAEQFFISSLGVYTAVVKTRLRRCYKPLCIQWSEQTNLASKVVLANL
jgi:hypothetical protein